MLDKLIYLGKHEKNFLDGPKMTYFYRLDLLVSGHYYQIYIFFAPEYHKFINRQYYVFFNDIPINTPESDYFKDLPKIRKFFEIVRFDGIIQSVGVTKDLLNEFIEIKKEIDEIVMTR